MPRRDFALLLGAAAVARPRVLAEAQAPARLAIQTQWLNQSAVRCTSEAKNAMLVPADLRDAG